MKTDTIPVSNTSTLPGLFRERARRSPSSIAYRQYDPTTQSWLDYSWQQTLDDIAHWQASFEKHDLQAGDRVAVMAHNSHEWVVYEQAALGLGLIVVPLYINDSADNVAYILNHAEAKMLFIDGDDQWSEISKEAKQFTTIKTILSLKPTTGILDERLLIIHDWLLTEKTFYLKKNDGPPSAMATIVYTSGTTGKPKGVMLSHQNILTNLASSLETVDVFTTDLFLSFLPLSHMLERTAGYYLPMMSGATVAFSRGVPVLGEDLLTIKPTILISVPRIYEKVYAKIMDGLDQKSPIARGLFYQAVDVGWHRFNYQQGRASWHPKLILWPLLEKIIARKVTEKLGGRLRIALTAGAAISPKIAELFIGLGVPILQGYGLTETSPVISVNTLESNDPASVGLAIPNVEIHKSEKGELMAKGPNVMLGYWKNQQATDEVIDQAGWFHSGDKIEMKDDHIYIVGRMKDIIVLSNGEKIPPNDMELAASLYPCFEQVLIIGEGRPFPTALIVLEPEQWAKEAKKYQLEGLALNNKKVEKFLVDKLAQLLKDFPGYATVHRAACTLEPWTVENAMLTPTLKTKRKIILENYAETVKKLYVGH